MEEARKALIAKLGENMSVRRFVRYETAGKLAAYLHGAKIGVLVDLAGGEEQVGKDVAMHIAASKPICVSKEQVPAENLRNRTPHRHRARLPQPASRLDIVAKMVEGRINKFLAESPCWVSSSSKPGHHRGKAAERQPSRCQRFHHVRGGRRHREEVEDYAAEVAGPLLPPSRAERSSSSEQESTLAQGCRHPPAAPTGCFFNCALRTVGLAGEIAEFFATGRSLPGPASAI